MQLKYFSMFSGIGGFELGIQKAFDNQSTSGIQQGINREDMPGSRSSPMASQSLCIGASEIDKYANQIYQKQFK